MKSLRRRKPIRPVSAEPTENRLPSRPWSAIRRESIRSGGLIRWDSDLIRLRDGGRDGNMILEVAGFGLTLGHTPMQRMELKKPRVWFNAFSNIELGFTQLVGVDYSGYASGEKGFLDQRLGSSFHFSFSAVQLRLALNRSRSLCLGVGMQYTLDNYRLSDNTITLGNDGGRVVPVALDEPAGKSKAVTSSLGIPVRLTYTPAKHLRITAVAYSDFLLGADAIYKKPKEKNSLSGFTGLSVRGRSQCQLSRFRVLHPLRRDSAVQTACGTPTAMPSRSVSDSCSDCNLT